MSIYIDRKALIEKYIVLKEKGMDLSKIRKQLIDQKIENLEVNELISIIDESVQVRQDRKVLKFKALNFLIVGFVLLLVSAVLSFGSMLGFLHKNTPMFFTYGSIIAGVGFMVNGVLIFFNLNKTK